MQLCQKAREAMSSFQKSREAMEALEGWEAMSMLENRWGREVALAIG